MSTIKILTQAFEFNRGRTLATLDEIEKLPDPQAALAYRLAPGRAHIAWQLVHIGVTEDIFANERLVPERPGRFGDLWPRFRGGSKADDQIPSVAEIREVLSESRAQLLATLSTFTDEQLDPRSAAVGRKEVEPADRATHRGMARRPPPRASARGAECVSGTQVIVTYGPTQIGLGAA